MLNKNLKSYPKQEVEKSTLQYFKGDELAANVWSSKYCLKDEKNYYELTPDDMHHRLAKEFFSIEKTYNNDVSENLSEYGKKRDALTEEKIFNYFKNFKYISPQGSIMNMLGNNNIIGSLSNCVVIPRPYDSYGGILYSDQQLAQLFKRRCVDENSYVRIKNKGLIKIKNINIGDYILSRNIITQEDEYNKVIDKFKTEVDNENKVKITLSNGTILFSSKKHPILIFDEKGYRYININDLKRGDVLVKPKTSKYFNDYSNESDINNISWFIGHHLGDGNAGKIKIVSNKTYGKKKYEYEKIRIRILSNSKECVENYERIHKALSQSKTTTHLSKRKDYKTNVWEYYSTINENEKIVDKYFDGQIGNKTYSSHVSNYIKNNNTWIPFLAGLIDADGYIKEGGTVEITLSNKNLIDEIGSYISSIGLFFHISMPKHRINEKTQYRLLIHYNENFFISLNKFIIHQQKHDKIKNYINKSHSKKIYISNNEKNEIINSFYNEKKRSKNSAAIIHILKNENCLSLSGYESLYNEKILNENKFNEIQQRIIVKDIENDNENREYLDIEVENVNNFYAGNFGMINIHNCGAGIDISSLRPNGTKVTNAAGTSTGAISFMERFSNTTREVGQNNRRGALMISIDVRHPDIFDFVKIKRDLKKVTGSNISVMLRDDFMESVIKNDKYVLRFPVDSKIEDALITTEINAIDLWNEIIKSAHICAEPGLIFKDRQHLYSTSSIYPNWENISTNPCQPSWANVLTPTGIKKFGDIQIGDKIWSKNGWTTIINKFSTGIKKVYKYSTTNNVFYGTENHKVVSNGNKIEVSQANSIDNIKGNVLEKTNHISEIVMDGIVLGDGSVHKASNNLVYLNIGKNDYNYFDGEIKHLILEKRNGLKKDMAYEIKTSISYNELPHTYNREIPERYFYGNSDIVVSFLRGLYSANGSIVDKRITLKSTSLKLIEQVRTMLSSIGISSYITKNKKKNVVFSNGTYECKESYDLNISKDRIYFYNFIGFIQKYKMDKLKNIIENIQPAHKKDISSKIICVDFISEEEVFDITVDNDTHTYWTEGCDVSNCSEIAMNDDSCRLMIVNYFGCVENPFTDDAKFNFNKLYEISYEAQRLIDDLIDLELLAVEKIINKIKNDSEPEHIKSIELKTWENLYNKGKTGRRTGLGFTGIGDVFASLGLKYDSTEAMNLLKKISETKFLAEFDSSIDMAIQRGKFDDFNPEYENKSEFVLMIKNEYPELYKRMMKFGRRNISISTVAPTGSLSILTQTTSGIEPLFMMGYKRRKKINPNEKNIKIDFIDELGDSWTEFDVLHPRLKEWKEINNIHDVNINNPYIGSTAAEIDWIKRIEIQSIVQKYVTHSISSTINLPKDVAPEKVGEIYMEAWKMKLKGITVYRDGSRNGVLISDETKKEITEFHENHAPKRPKRLKAEIHRFQNNLEKWIAVVGMKDGKPYELFTGLLENGLSKLPPTIKECEVVKNIIDDIDTDGKPIKIKRYDIEYVDNDGMKHVHTGLNHAFNPEYWNYAKLISGILRHGMPLIKVYELIDSLTFREENINTWKNGVVRVIKKYIKDGEKGKGICQNCGSEHLEFKEGCMVCMNCGASKCS